MPKSILSPAQTKFLKFFANEKALADNFYLTGGTALAEFYLKHRISQDLDFFSLQEFSPQDTTPYVKKSKKALGWKKFDFEQSFNRNLYHLHLPKKEFLKIEFTYFPFPQIEKPKKIAGVRVDSLLDIAVNKVFSISQNPRGRDFFDLYFILQEKPWNLRELILRAKAKFDWHVDPLQLGSQLLKVKKMRDDPIITGEENLREVEDFILAQAKKLSEDIFK